MNTVPKEVKVIVRSQSENPTKMYLTSGKFSMVIDEPINMGAPMMDLHPFKLY